LISYLFRLFFALIIFYLPLFVGCSLDFSKSPPPKAVKGVLDLTDWDFKIDGSVDLIGKYEFYWRQHLAPSEFSKTILPLRLISHTPQRAFFVKGKFGETTDEPVEAKHRSRSSWTQRLGKKIFMDGHYLKQGGVSQAVGLGSVNKIINGRLWSLQALGGPPSSPVHPRSRSEHRLIR
jgi:hypothetical protein